MILAIYGTGGTGREVWEIIHDTPTLSKRWDDVVFIDDVSEERSLFGSTIMPFREFVLQYKSADAEVMIAVGEPESRSMLFKRVNACGYRFATIVHPSAFVAPSAKLAQGVFVKMQSIISSNAVLEENVFIQANVIVGHDAHIERHCQVSAFSHIAGGAHLGERCYLGVRSSVREGSCIGNDSVLGMGAVVMEKHVPGQVLAVGNPAKYVRRKAGSKVFS